MSDTAGWHIVSTAWDLTREHLHGSYTEEELIKRIVERLAAHGATDVDEVLARGAIKVAVAQGMIRDLSNGRYTHYRTSGTRMGGLNAGDITQDMLRRYGAPTTS
jgi:hypothetical protein